MTAEPYVWEAPEETGDTPLARCIACDEWTPEYSSVCVVCGVEQER